AAFGYAGEFAEHTIAQPFVKRPRLETGCLKIREQIPVISGVVLNRGQQRGAIAFAAVVFGDPHAGDVDRRAPKVSLRAADYAPILISQKARNRSRRFVPDDGLVEAADSIDDLPQLVRRWMLVQLKRDGSQRHGTPSSVLSLTISTTISNPTPLCSCDREHTAWCRQATAASMRVRLADRLLNQP